MNYMTTADGWRCDVELVDEGKPQAFLSKGRCSGSLALAEMNGMIESDDGAEAQVPPGVLRRCRAFARAHGCD